jgi:CRISPR-associated protein Csd2
VSTLELITLQHKIDFAVVLRVKHANPNGDPLNGNRPRTDYNGSGEISDVCLKRKMRDRLMEKGQNIFVQSDDRKVDGMRSLRERAEHDKFGLGKQAFALAAKKAKKPKKGAVDEEAAKEAPGELAQKDETITAACAKWFDVRAFGNLFAWKAGEGKKKEDSEDAESSDDSSTSSVSIGIRGPVTVQSAFSLKPVDVTSTQITKSVNSEGDGSKRGTDTMGMKHRVDDAVYVFYGSMNPQLAERTGFSDADAEAIKAVLPKLFENDASSARPEGSMEVLKVLWWKQPKPGKYSSAKVHASLKMNEDGNGGYTITPLAGLSPEEKDGF